MNELIIEVATSCPNRCLHCSSECGFVDGGGLKFEEFKTLVSAARETGFETLVFSGGEPLAFPLLPEFIAYAKMSGFSTKIYTSGAGDEKVIEKLFGESGYALPDAMVFSCYGDTPDINAAVTGNGLFFHNLRGMLSRAKKLKVRAELNFVPMKLNYRSLRQTFLMFADAIESFNLLRLVRQGNAVRNWEHIQVDDKDLEPVLTGMAAYCKFNVGRSFRLDSCPAFKQCEAGSKKICVSSDGYILPCEVFKQNRFEFKNIHAIAADGLLAVFKKFSTMRVRSEGRPGCFKNEIRRLSLGGL